MLRNFVLAVVSGLCTTVVVLALRLEKCQTECSREIIETVERLKNERIRDMENVQSVLVRQGVLEKELGEAKAVIADLQKRLRRK